MKATMKRNPLKHQCPICSEWFPWVDPDIDGDDEAMMRRPTLCGRCADQAYAADKAFSDDTKRINAESRRLAEIRAGRTTT